MKRPGFLFIGPDKSGSTWLYEVCRAHPGLFVPPLKDPYFFDREYARGLGWYARLFEGAGDRLAGEFSHDYLFADAACERIHRDLPGVKLVSILRHPADRSLSHYRYLKRSGWTGTSFAEACTAHPEILDHSHYARHLPRYLRRFPREQLGLFLFDDLRADPHAFAAAVFAFLGVDPDPGITLPGPINPSSLPRFPWLARTARTSATLLRRAGAHRLLGVLKRSPFLQRSLFSGGRAIPEDEDAIRHYLRGRFEDDIRLVEETTGRTLDTWRP
jgi:hypothetical protein